MRAHGTPDGFVAKIGAPFDETGPARVDQTARDGSITRIEHQLGNLLTIISVNLELIDRSVQDTNFRSRVALMRASVESRLATLESIGRRNHT